MLPTATFDSHIIVDDAGNASPISGTDAQKNDACLYAGEQQSDVTISGAVSAGEIPEDAAFLERRRLAAAGIWGRARVAENGCWEWLGAKSDKGYGIVSIGSRNHPAHRLLYEILDGPLRRWDYVCHSCSNKGCVNPVHLVRGTNRSNQYDRWDMEGKGRPRSLTEAQAAAARLRWRDGERAEDIAASMDCTPATIRNYCRGLRREKPVTRRFK